MEWQHVIIYCSGIIGFSLVLSAWLLRAPPYRQRLEITIGGALVVAEGSSSDEIDSLLAVARHHEKIAEVP